MERGDRDQRQRSSCTGECGVEADTAVASKTTFRKHKEKPEGEDWGMACWVELVFFFFFSRIKVPGKALPD